MNTNAISNTQSTMQVLNIPVEEIIPNRFQPRLNFDDASLKELAASIKEHGIIQPLVLRNLGDKYEIIAGERRYKAAKLAGLTQVPAIISSMDDKKSAEVAIVENVQRRDLSSIEEAKSYKALLDKGYLTQEELAKKMGLSQSAISNKLRLLSLSDNVQQALIEGKISERHARSLLQLNDLAEQDKWLNIIVNERITVKELDRRLKKELTKEEVPENTANSSQKEKNDEIPLIDSTPNINVIKQNATDIVKPSKYEDIIPPEQMPKEDNPGIIPNKFFNYLEDVAINMNSAEISNDDNEDNANTEELESSNGENTEGESEQKKEESLGEIKVVNQETNNVSSIENMETLDNKEILEVPSNANVQEIKDIQKVPEIQPEQIINSNNEEEIELLDFVAPVKEEKNTNNSFDSTNLSNNEIENKIIEEMQGHKENNAINMNTQEIANNSVNNSSNDGVVTNNFNVVKDFTQVKELFTELENKIQNLYRIDTYKEENEKELRYTITISKE